MGERTVARVIGILLCAGLIWAGIGSAGFALVAILAPRLGLAGAAALTGAILLAVSACVGLFLTRRRSGELGEVAADAVLGIVASVARERPLLAVLGAAVLGAAEVFLKPPRKR